MDKWGRGEGKRGSGAEGLWLARPGRGDGLGAEPRGVEAPDCRASGLAWGGRGAGV